MPPVNLGIQQLDPERGIPTDIIKESGNIINDISEDPGDSNSAPVHAKTKEADTLVE